MKLRLGILNKKIKVSLSIISFLSLIGIVLSVLTIHPALSSTELCLSCHEMDKPFAEYQQTIHYKSTSGVRAECSSCHIPNEFGPRLYAKVISGGRHLYGNILGTLGPGEKDENARLRMAERVWADMKAHDSRECRSCHNQHAFKFEDFTIHRDGLKMSQGLKDGKTCIDCHKGIAHKMPDMSSGYKSIQKKLVAASFDPDIEEDTVFPLETVISYPNEGTEREARILGGTKLKVVENKGKWLKVRIDGWQQQGVDAMIYELQGKRIFSVALDKTARGKPVVHSTFFDEDTEQTWHKVSFETWVSNKGLIQDEEKLWEYGEKLHAGNCGSCHMAIPAEHFLANQWIGVMKDMKRNIRHLSKEQYRFLQKYLQLNAKDVQVTHH